MAAVLIGAVGGNDDRLAVRDRPYRVHGVADEVHEHLHHAIGIAGEHEVGGDAAVDLDRRGIAVQAHEQHGFLDQRREGHLPNAAGACAGEVTPKELQCENSVIRSAGDILYTDFSPKGTPEQWERFIQYIKDNY